MLPCTGSPSDEGATDLITLNPLKCTRLCTFPRNLRRIRYTKSTKDTVTCYGAPESNRSHPSLSISSPASVSPFKSHWSSSALSMVDTSFETSKPKPRCFKVRAPPGSWDLCPNVGDCVMAWISRRIDAGDIRAVSVTEDSAETDWPCVTLDSSSNRTPALSSPSTSPRIPIPGTS